MSYYRVCSVVCVSRAELEGGKGGNSLVPCCNATNDIDENNIWLKLCLSERKSKRVVSMSHFGSNQVQSLSFSFIVKAKVQPWLAYR